MAEGFNQALFTAASIAAGDRVLDIGCGTGQTTLLAAEQAVRGQVTGVDLSDSMLAMARVDAAERKLANIEFLHADAQVHPFPEAGFDVAISRSALMLCRDRTPTVTTLGRPLRCTLYATVVASTVRCQLPQRRNAYPYAAQRSRLHRGQRRLGRGAHPARQGRRRRGRLPLQHGPSPVQPRGRRLVTASRRQNASG
ncbi:class I SAM-dependent methyltransferase [Amycolatopsis coloradensis]|uniref:class I SAM-dependent methyltransferase n=1 Tax=Amycolatopsis coloradensis TaxID=76021 RepID=UPI001FCA3572|nr:class I SAM-dependent methyltransferase [Amycolatopsis coloradensis]